MKKKQNVENSVDYRVTFEFVEKIRQTFADADTDQTGYLDVNEFTVFMRKTFPKMTDRDAQLIFMKIDTNCDGEVDLSEYLTYILFEHRERELMSNMSKAIPYPNPVENFPSKILSSDFYIGFRFFPALFRSGERLDRIDFSYGRYISISRHGVVSHWSLSFELLRQTQIESTNSSKKILPFWICSMCVLPDSNSFVVGTTDDQLIFFDLNSHRYVGSIFITDFPHRITALDYRLSSKDRTAILCGDANGNLFVFQRKDFSRPMFHNSESTRIFSLNRILCDDYSTVSARVFCHVHLDVVQQIRWIDDLELVVSCATTSRKSLFITDINGKTTKYAVATKGFSTFDYSKTQRTIVTGGNDGIIRFWDPFVTERASAVLRVHYLPIVQLLIDNRDEQLISIDKNKNLIISSLETMKILQRISPIVFELPNDDLTIGFLNPESQRLIIGNSRLVFLRHVNESFVDRQRTSHSSPITRSIYNSLFDVFISADESSTIHIWNLKTMEKSMQILNVHLGENDRPVEITAMICDETQRRLITGAHDGSLALWNFNNGHNLSRISSDGNDEKEITALLHENERLFVAGWAKKIRVYHLAKSVVMRKSFPIEIRFFIDKIVRSSFFLVDEFRSLHRDDILSMDIMMNVLATSSYDGEIYLWTIETGKALMKFNAIEQIYRQFDEKRRFNDDFHLDQLVFLRTREISPSTASLFASGSFGWIWCWSIHVTGKLVAVFNGSRLPQEHISAMCLDEKCQILFTSDTAGYVAVWFIGDFATKQSKNDEILQEKRRIQNRFSSQQNSNFHQMKIQAEEKLREQLGTPWIPVDDVQRSFLMEIFIYPTLLVAFRAHLRPISSINFVSTHELILTSSIDSTIRIFTLNGRYIGFLGETISFDRKKLPEDIRRKGSATTLEVLRGDIGKRWKLLKHTIVTLTSLPMFRNVAHRVELPEEKVQNIIERKERRDLRLNPPASLIEAMLKATREQFGVTMPILGNFTRKFMKHRERTKFDRIRIQNGNAQIFSLLPIENLRQIENSSIIEGKKTRNSSVRRSERTQPICSSNS